VFRWIKPFLTETKSVVKPGRKSRKFKEHNYIVPTRNGLFYLFGVIAVFLVGLISGQHLINFFGFYLLTFFLVGMFQTNRNINKIEIKRIETQPVALGSVGTVSVVLVNHDTAPCFGLFMELDAGIQKFTGTLDVIPQETTVAMDIPLPTAARGVSQLSTIQLYTVFPIGLFHAWKWRKIDHECIVYPKPAGSTALEPAAVSQGDVMRIRHLTGEDFSGHRLYQRGDSQRRIDWKARARGLPLMVKEFEESGQEARMLRWEDLTGLDTETRLSQLTLWVLDCQDTKEPYALVLPHITIATGTSELHFYACLRELARYEVPHEA
jgi:uncharacterized protein (DUF58 family)